MNNIPDKISNDTTLDSRDIEARIRYLQYDLPVELMTTEDYEELEELVRVRNDVIEVYGDEYWEFGLFFVRDDYFIEYAEEYLAEMGAFDKDFPLIANNINWEGVAKDLQFDYTQIDLFDTVYWCR